MVIDKDLESLIKSCPECAAVKQAQPSAPLHPWICLNQPQQRIHLDFAGPFLDKYLFIVVDGHSKWAKVVEMPQTSTIRIMTVICNSSNSGTNCHRQWSTVYFSRLYQFCEI